MVMQSDYAAHFVRQMTSTERDWLNRLDAAIAPHRIIENGAGRVVIDIQRGIERGTLTIVWKPLPPTGTALLRLDRLEATFSFRALSHEGINEFMRKFDLYMHRGGG